MKWLTILFLCLSLHVNAQTKVLAFAGSTRKDSANKKLSAEAARLAKSMGAETTWIDLQSYPIPFFDEDLEARSFD